MLNTREAVSSDAPAIAAIHNSAWQAGYRGLLPDELLESLDVADRTAFWADVIGRHRDASVLTVAELGGEVCGFADLRPSVERAAAGTVGAVYVAPGRWREGIGTALMQAVERTARHKGFTALELHVLVGNDRAARFYERLGWVSNGVHEAHSAAGHPAEVVRYERALT